jgi:hypothetical protein
MTGESQSVVELMARAMDDAFAYEGRRQGAAVGLPGPRMPEKEAGYVLVPKEPTVEMVYAGQSAAGYLAAPEGYRAMLAAAPKDE